MTYISVTMDIYDLTQITVVVSAAVVLGRIGWSIARAIDRRVARPALPGDAAERLRALEDEQQTLRQELAELQERQDFTERALLRDQNRIVTPR
jgi:hypothetical protein